MLTTAIFRQAAVGGSVVHNLGVAGVESELAVIGFFAAVFGIPLFLITYLITVPLCAADR